MQTRTVPLEVKAAGSADGLAEGQFIGYASVFGNVDSYGDIVEKGAFTRTLKEWDSKTAQIPVLWGHDMHDPFANIGGLEHAEEDDYGLKVVGTLDLENPTAAQVYRLLKSGRASTMSFAFLTRDSERRGNTNHLLDLDLLEVSVVPVPANDQATILNVKRGNTLVPGSRARALNYIAQLQM